MCKNWVEFKEGKIIKTKGLFKKGHYVICLDCKEIIKIFKKETKIICSLVLNKGKKKWNTGKKCMEKEVKNLSKV